MIDPVVGWFEVNQYDDKKMMIIAILVKATWLSRYLWPSEITYDRGYEFLGQEFKNTLIEK